MSTLLCYCLPIGFIGSYYNPILPSSDVGDIGVKAAECPRLPVKCPPTSRDLDIYKHQKYATAGTIFNNIIHIHAGLTVCSGTMFEQWTTFL